jgi:hypothetical protein
LANGAGILRYSWQRLQFRRPILEGKAYDLFLSTFTLVPPNGLRGSAKRTSGRIVGYTAVIRPQLGGLRSEAPPSLFRYNSKSLAQCLGFYPMTLIYSGVGFAAAVWFNSRCNCISWRNSSMLGWLADCDGNCTQAP